MRAVASADVQGGFVQKEHTNKPAKKKIQGTYEQLAALYVCSENLFGAGTQ